jgi:MFS family permease
MVAHIAVQTKHRQGIISIMPFRFAPIAPVLVGILCAQIALGLMGPLIPLLLVGGGIATPVIGLIASAYFVGFLAGALSCYRIVTAIGHIRAFAVFAAVAADAALLMALADSPAIWAAMRAMIGYCNAGLSLVAESWLNERSDRTTRGRTLGAYMVASWGAGVLGPLLINVAPPSPLLFAVVGLAFTTAVLPMALTRQPNPEIKRDVQLGLGQLFRISPAGVACCLTAGLVNSVFYALVPVFLTTQGYGARIAANFIAAANLAGLAVQAPVGFFSDWVGRRPVAVAVLVSSCTAAVLMGLRENASLSVFMLVGCLFAGCTAPLYSLGSSLTNDRLERGEALAATGGLLFSWAAGSTVGPAFAGSMMGRFGPSGLFGYLAAVLGVIGVFICARMLQRSEVPREQRSVFVPAPAAPAYHSELAAHGGQSRTADLLAEAQPAD